MMIVREKGDYEQWVRFFLSAVLETANDAIEAIDKLILLHDKNSLLIQDMGRSVKSVSNLFRYFEENPIIEIKKTATELGMAFNTVAAAVNKLCEVGILKQTNKAGSLSFVK